MDLAESGRSGAYRTAGQSALIRPATENSVVQSGHVARPNA